MSAYENLVSPAKLTIVPFREEQAHRNVFWVVLEHLRYLCNRIVGCWHRRMSFPFSRGGETYRVCLRCGMRRQFDLAKWKMKGRYYNDARSTQAGVKTNGLLTHQQICSSTLRQQS